MIQQGPSWNHVIDLVSWVQAFTFRRRKFLLFFTTRIINVLTLEI